MLVTHVLAPKRWFRFQTTIDLGRPEFNTILEGCFFRHNHAGDTRFGSKTLISLPNDYRCWEAQIQPVHPANADRGRGGLKIKRSAIPCPPVYNESLIFLGLCVFLRILRNRENARTQSCGGDETQKCGGSKVRIPHPRVSIPHPRESIRSVE